MAQGHDLGLHCGASSKAREKGIEQHQYKVEHSGGRLPVFGEKSNISNAYDADVVFRKDSRRPMDLQHSRAEIGPQDLRSVQC